MQVIPQEECQRQPVTECKVSVPFYFKYIEIPYDKCEILNFFNSKPKYTSTFEILKPSEVLPMLPSISEWFDQQNLVPAMVAYIALGGNSKQRIHTDTQLPSLAINIPVHNCETAKTYFYHTDSPETAIFHTKDTNVPANGYDEIAMKEVCHYTLNRPAIINIKEPHSVDNDNPNTRYCLSFRFFQDPVHLIN